MFLPEWLPSEPSKAFEAKKTLDGLVLIGDEIRAHPGELERGERWSWKGEDPLAAWFESARTMAATRAQHANVTPAAPASVSVPRSR